MYSEHLKCSQQCQILILLLLSYNLVTVCLWVLYRASFKGSTSLQEVCSYVNQQRPSGKSNGYRVVSLHLGKEFSQTDLSSSLAELGVQSQTSLRLRNKQASAGQTPRVPCLDHSHIYTVYNC